MNTHSDGLIHVFLFAAKHTKLIFGNAKRGTNEEFSSNKPNILKKLFPLWPVLVYSEERFITANISEFDGSNSF